MITANKLIVGVATGFRKTPLIRLSAALFKKYPPRLKNSEIKKQSVKLRTSLPQSGNSLILIFYF